MTQDKTVQNCITLNQFSFKPFEQLIELVKKLSIRILIEVIAEHEISGLHFTIKF